MCQNLIIWYITKNDFQKIKFIQTLTIMIRFRFKESKCDGMRYVLCLMAILMVKSLLREALYFEIE